MNQPMQGNKLQGIAVFCASNDGFDPEIFEEAYEVGEFLANHRIELIFGGSKLGLMGQVAKGALDNNGKVTGVIPEFLKSKEVVHTGLTSLITTRDMHQRKLKMHDLSDGFIALPGGFGTMEELFEILTWGQLGLHRKPIGILNSNHYYDDLLEFLQKMLQRGLLKESNMNLLLVSDNIEDLILKMIEFKPLAVPKWMNKEQT